MRSVRRHVFPFVPPVRRQLSQGSILCRHAHLAISPAELDASSPCAPPLPILSPARVIPKKPLALPYPRGDTDRVEQLHRSLLDVQEAGIDEGIIERARNLLARGGAEGAVSTIHEYLGESVRRGDRHILRDLDAQLLAHFGVLLEDLTVPLLERWFAAHESTSTFFKETYALLYGKDAEYPILHRASSSGAASCSSLQAPRSQCISEVTLRRRQLAIERQVSKSAVAQYFELQREMAEGGRVASLGSLTRVWFPWVINITRSIEQLKLKDPTELTSEQKLLCSLNVPAEVLGVIACQTALNTLFIPPSFKTRKAEPASEPVRAPGEVTERMQSVPYVTLICGIGEAIKAEEVVRNAGAIQPSNKNGKLSQRDIGRLIRRNRSADMWDTVHQTVPFGAALVDLLVSCAKVEVDVKQWRQERESRGEIVDSFTDLQPEDKIKVDAFVHEVRREGRKTVGYVNLQKAAQQQMFNQDGVDVPGSLTKHQPMVVEPRPWRPSAKRHEGGFLLHREAFIRTTDQESTQLRMYNCQKVSRAMDFLGSTPWRVNPRILEVMQRVWERGGDIAGVPPSTDPDLPAHPDLGLYSKDDQKRLLLQRDVAMRKSNSYISERPTFLLKLQAAENFQHADRLFFPHNVDFRGRAYPVPPHLNHIGDDVCRGLLMFAEPKELGERGLYWLKVNLGNLIGKDKAPFDERVQYVDDLRERIMSAAKEPLAEENLSLWANAPDGPWQALARIFELSEAWASGSPQALHSHMPVHMDGSCNGLQHYAALGRDEAGAIAVNLCPSDRPQDVYSIVLEIVKEKVFKDAAAWEKTKSTPQPVDTDSPEEDGTEGVSSPGRSKSKKIDLNAPYLAHQLVHYDLLKRKVVKQTIMTICYGVTSLGAKQQVKKQLEDLVGEEVEAQEISLMATYLSRLVLKSIDEVFERAMEIKAWFDKVSKVLNGLYAPVAWLSPMGLACTQPYKKQASIKVKTTRQSVSVRGHGHERPPTDKIKQRMGFPPNFVHSLDSSHMMMVADGCQREKLVFASVHDSFWTHAADADDLNRIIRDSFFELHSRPLLADLREDITLHLGGDAHLLPELPPQGSLDLALVKQSPYMFD